MEENKAAICDKLFELLKMTNEYRYLTELKYEKEEYKQERVTVRFGSGKYFKINVNMDSGIAIIRDVLRGLQYK